MCTPDTPLLRVQTVHDHTGTDKKAAAYSVPSTLNVAGVSYCTVTLRGCKPTTGGDTPMLTAAGEVVALPIELVTTQEYAPTSAWDMECTTNCGPFAPGMTWPFLSQAKVHGGIPITAHWVSIRTLKHNQGHSSA